MKRFIIILLIFNLQSSIFNVLWAQPHVDAAFRALALEANHGEMPEERVNRSSEDARFTLSMHVPFYLRPEQQGLLTAVYEAMESDCAMRTQYYLQDAFSAEHRPIRMDTPHYSSYWLIDESTNVLWGGFFVPADENVDLPPEVCIEGQPHPTLYRYYFLSYQIDVDGMLSGFIMRITFDADTQEPYIQQPSPPKFQPLIDAITAFGADNNVQLRRNLSERRASATGQWTHIHSTLGFNLPLEDEARLLGPLWKAFLNEEQHAYRFLNKPAGQVASDVQIIYDEEGHTLGLGSQQGWNIVYVYFTDEDFPRNRYVYALWYKTDVPRQRIVGELIKINTLRPEGGTVDHPFVQTTVPTYLWRMTINPYDYRRIDDQDVVILPSYGMSPDFARMRNVLADLPNLDLQPLRFMLDTLMTGRARQLDAFNVEMLDIQDRYRESLEGLRGMLKLNVDAKEYARMTPQERIDYNNKAREEYQAELDRLNKMYSEYMENIAHRCRAQDYGIFRRDSMPSDVFRATFGALTMAYRGDGSEQDALVAERLRQMAEMASDEASRPVRLEMFQKLDSIASLPHPNLPRNILSVPRQSLAEAVMVLDVRPYAQPSSETKVLIDNKTFNDAQVQKSASSNHPTVHSEEAFRQKFDHYYRIAHTRLRQFKQQGQPLRHEALGAVQQLCDHCRYNSVYARPRIKQYISKLKHGLVPKINYATPDMTDDFELVEYMINDAVEQLRFLDDFDNGNRNPNTKVKAKADRKAQRIMKRATRRFNRVQRKANQLNIDLTNKE